MTAYPLNPKHPHKFPLPAHVKADNAGVLKAAGPAEVIEAGEEGGAEGAGEVAAAVAPIEAGFAQGAAELFERFKINGELFKEALSALGEAEALILRCEEIFREQAVHHLHAEIAREMVVADSRMAERRVLRAGPGAEMSLLRGEAHHRLQQAADIVIGKREIAVPPLLALNEKAAGLHFREVGAGRLRGNARFARELARRQCLAREQRGQHVGPRRFPDQRA